MKMVLFGPSGSGKSTIGKVLKAEHDFPVLEVDNRVCELNNDSFPENEKLLDRLMEQINKEVSQMDNVFYITSWLEKKDIKKFHMYGFQIILLHADYEVLLQRKRNRYGDIKTKFQRNYMRYREIIEDSEVQKLFFLQLDSSKRSTEELLEEIVITVAVDSELNSE